MIQRRVRKKARVGPSGFHGNIVPLRSFATQLFGLRNLPLSHANCPCIFRFLRGVLLSLLLHLMTHFCPADLQFPRPSNFSHSFHKLPASFLCVRRANIGALWLPLFTRTNYHRKTELRRVLQVQPGSRFPNSRAQGLQRSLLILASEPEGPGASPST